MSERLPVKLSHTFSILFVDDGTNKTEEENKVFDIYHHEHVDVTAGSFVCQLNYIFASFTRDVCI